MPRFGTYEAGDPDYELWRTARQPQDQPVAPAPTPIDTGGGSVGTGDLSSPSDPTTGSDGSGSGGLSPNIAPAVVIGLDLARPDPEQSVEAAELAVPTHEALSKDRRKRSMYTELKRKTGPTTSGLNL